MAKENNYNVLAKPTAKRGRNAFNLNNQHVYSMKAGLINPVKAIHFMPGDYFKLKATDFTISFPMKSAPFLRARKEFSFYSVYYSAVWSLFNQYMAGRQDPKSSAFGSNPTLQEPRIKLLNMYAACLNQFGAYVFLEHLLPQHIRVTIPSISDTDVSMLVNNAKENFFDSHYTPYYYSADYVYSGQTYTFTWDMTDYYTTAFKPLSWNSFDVTPYGYSDDSPVRDLYQDVVGHYRIYNWLRKLDMYGYGNYYALFNNCEKQILDTIANYSDYENFDNFMTHVNFVVYLVVINLVRSLCTYDNTIPINNLIESNITSFKMVNLYPLCAHNAIFYHFFRNSFYDNEYNPHDYNLDFVSINASGHGNFNEVSMNDFTPRFLDCEYHQWKKDMFTSVLPDEQFGAVSSISLSSLTQVTGSDKERWTIVGGSSITPNIDVYTYQNYLGQGTSQEGSGAPIVHTHTFKPSDVSFDMIALKRAEMLQEYRQTLMRAGNKTTDVFRALYGGAPSSEHVDDIIPRFLETFGEDIAVDPVISTANTEQGDNGKLGDISARCKSNGQSREFKFDAGDNFGCIVCLAYVVPTSMYNSYMLDKYLTELTPEQHFIPNFENCGLEDVYSDELNILLPANDIHSLGKQARYYHKKTDVDKVHGAFVAQAVPYIADDVSLITGAESNDNIFYGVFNHWISSRLDMQNRSITTLRDFYINPSVLDNVFVRAAGADQADDQFISTTLIEVDATKAISKVGMVNFV